MIPAKLPGAPHSEENWTKKLQLTTNKFSDLEIIWLSARTYEIKYSLKNLQNKRCDKWATSKSNTQGCSWGMSSKVLWNKLKLVNNTHTPGTSLATVTGKRIAFIFSPLSNSVWGEKSPAILALTSNEKRPHRFEISISESSKDQRKLDLGEALTVHLHVNKPPKNSIFSHKKIMHHYSGTDVLKLVRAAQLNNE